MKILSKYKAMAGLLVLASLLFLVVQHIDATAHTVRVFWRAIYPLILGVCIAFIMNIVVLRIESIYFPKSNHSFIKATRRPFSIITAFLLIISAVTIVLWMVVPQTIHSLTIVIEILPTLYMKTYDFATYYLSQLSPASVELVTNSFSVESLIEKASALGIAWIAKFVVTISTAVSVAFDWIVGIFFAIYILIHKEHLSREIKEVLEAYFSEKVRKHSYYVADILYETFSSFFVGQFLDAMILGLLVSLGMTVFGLPYAFNIGCVIGITAFIPVLGAYIGGAIGIVMLLVESPWHTGIFIIILMVMQQIEGNFIYPKLVGSSVGLPGIWVFAAVIVGGNLFGIVGMLLAVPLGAAVYKYVQQDVKSRLYGEGAFLEDSD